MGEQRHIVVETVKLTKIFRDFWLRQKAKALDSVDLQIHGGEIFGLLGPNGSGKSTFVKILLGLLFPTSGKAAVFGHDPKNIAVKDRIGYMPEESYLYRYLNADETLNFYGRLFNLPRRERKHRVNLLLDMVGLSRQRRRPIVEYSKGMARRIGLAQALINDPDVLFLDEPTTGLDPIGTREMKDLVLELKKRGKTVLLCSHLLADVEDVCDRVAILYGGKVRQLGTVEELLSVRSQTQITVEQLRPDTVNRLVALIQEREGPEKEVTVRSPRERLEQFFLKVVEEARRARVETAGTVVGTGAAAFFEEIAREGKADTILEDLLQGAKLWQAAPPARAEAPEGEGPSAAPTEKQPVVIPSARPEPEPDKQLLHELVETAGPPEPSATETTAGAEPTEEGPAFAGRSSGGRRPVVLPAGEKKPPERPTKDVLEGLLKPGKRDEEEETEKEE